MNPSFTPNRRVTGRVWLTGEGTQTSRLREDELKRNARQDACAPTALGNLRQKKIMKSSAGLFCFKLGDNFRKARRDVRDLLGFLCIL